MSIDSKFLGTGWGFPPAFDPRTREAVMVTQQQDVEESLRILLSTSPGERVMHPNYGCGLLRMVFENMDESRLTEIRSLVERAVLFFEPRVILHELLIDTDDLFEGILRLRLDYSIRTTNTRHNLVYPLYLAEATQRAVRA
jgi:Bacteriophage baseplate protein W